MIDIHNMPHYECGMFVIKSICRGGGYRYCRTEPPHPNRNTKGLYPLHRVLMENKLGRLLSYNELVHHKDGNKSNDSIENLDVISRGDHTVLHMMRGDNVPPRHRCIYNPMMGAGDGI